MRLEIIGVAQTLDFATGQMVDQLQVRKPDGQVVSVPAAQETINALVQMVMGNGHTRDTDNAEISSYGYHKDPEGPQSIYRSHEDTRSADPSFPDEAAIFGEESTGLDPAYDPEGKHIDLDGPQDEAQELAEAYRSGLFKKTQAIKPSSLGVRRNDGDSRSGVPSYSLARVDEMGNPVLPAPPDDEEEDYEEDPGEQI